MAQASYTEAEAAAWLAKFRAAGAGTTAPDVQKIKACRREIWKQTSAYVFSPHYCRLHCRTICSFKVKCPGSFVGGEVGTWATVLNQDILDLAWSLGQQGQKVAVLNMASDTRAGGGVARGAGAQEENLYRRTDMCFSMGNNQCQHYPLKGQALLTHPVMLLRGQEEDGYPFLTPPVQVSVISCAAVREPPLDDLGGYASLNIEQKMRQAVRNILEAAVLSQCDVLLLSAFGCGAYKNPPHEVAQIFKQELAHRNLGQVFFCIQDDHNAGHYWNPSGNYHAFKVFFPCCEVSWQAWHCYICGKQW